MTYRVWSEIYLDKIPKANKTSIDKIVLEVQLDNRGLILVTVNFPKEKKIYDFPIYLLIEPVSACNLRCVMCFQIDESFTSDSGFMGNMDLNLFKKTIDEAVEGGTKAITLASRGEPTLHPHLGEMLEYCKGKFFELKINTNATLLNEKLIHHFCERKPSLRQDR